MNFLCKWVILRFHVNFVRGVFVSAKYEHPESLQKRLAGLAEQTHILYLIKLKDKVTIYTLAN